MTGVPLKHLANARVAVEAAWGADLTAASGTWTWSDVTAAVRFAAQPVGITLGRADEASQAQPARCQFTLHDPDGDYTPDNPLGANWPHVRRNTPIRVRVSLDNGSTWYVRFQGYADGFSPDQDITGRADRSVAVSASGVLRRLGQRTSPLTSFLRIYTLASTPAVAYWPMEDGRDASRAVAATDATAIETTGVTFASDSDLSGSAPLPVLTASSTLDGAAPAYTYSSHWQVDWYMRLPAAAPSAATVIMRVFTTGSAITTWDIRLETDGTATLIGYSPSGTAVVTVTELGGPTFPPLTGQWTHMYLSNISGSPANWNYAQTGMDSGLRSHFGSSSGSIGNVIGFAIPAAAGIAGIALGHLAIRDSYNVHYDLDGGLSVGKGLPGEAPDDRLTRLCGENGIEFATIDTYEARTAMGPQRFNSLPNLLREVESADLGYLYDGWGAGLTYQGVSQRYAQAAAITLDASAGEVGYPFGPVDDDQRNLNKATVSRVDGSAQTWADDTGDLGTAAIGTYDTSITINLQDDTGLLYRAQWEVHAGTIPGLRYPTVVMDLVGAPGVAASWMARADGPAGPVPPGSRLDITGLHDVDPRYRDETLSVVLEGWTETISPHAWTVAANCSPHQTYEVMVLEDTRLGRFDSAGGHTLSAGVSPGATSLVVLTSAVDRRWTINPDGLIIEIDGIPIAVSAITPASSPQTFTVTGVVKALAGGAPVRVWRNGVLAL